jgi:low temperature requirement protein LtrA
VVLVAQAGHHLAGHLSWGGLGEYAVIFTLVWIAWVNGSLHHELHGHEDARARLTFLLQILVLAAMGAFIPEADGARGAAFAVAAGVLFAVLAVLWLLAARGDEPQFRRPSWLFVTGTVASAVLLAGTAVPRPRARGPARHPLDARGHPQASPRRALARRQERPDQGGEPGRVTGRSRARARPGSPA